MNKSLITNLIAILIIVGGYFSPLYREHLLSIGFFAFSGAITNWLAVYMLFEKVPFLYGSGVVENNFEKFKTGINNLIMDQFFTEDNISRFISKAGGDIPIEKIVNNFDFNKIFDSLIETVMSSQLGAMLGMFGGAQALEPMRAPMINNVKGKIIKMASEDSFKESLSESLATDNSDTLSQINKIVESRLDELTPKMVKEIIQKMIKEHLGWLVVWGGVFGGIIGLIMSIVQNL